MNQRQNRQQQWIGGKSLNPLIVLNRVQNSLGFILSSLLNKFWLVIGLLRLFNCQTPAGQKLLHLLTAHCSNGEVGESTAEVSIFISSDPAGNDKFIGAVGTDEFFNSLHNQLATGLIKNFI